MRSDDRYTLYKIFSVENCIKIGRRSRRRSSCNSRMSCRLQAHHKTLITSKIDAPADACGSIKLQGLRKQSVLVNNFNDVNGSCDRVDIY